MGGGEREVSAEELAQHALESDCWIALHGSVYDVTAWLKLHPGGSELILENAGTDASDEFDAVGHSPAAVETLQNMRLGRLKGATRREPRVKASPPEPPRRAGRPLQEDNMLLPAAATAVAAAALALAVYLSR